MPRKLLIASSIVAVVALAPVGQLAAHVFVDHTTLTIKASPTGPVTAGQVVTISGRLVGKPECRAFQPIELIRLGTAETQTTTTDAQGRYTFQVTVSEDSAFQAHFRGTRDGRHPHAHVCSASTSRVLRIRVRGGGGSTRDGTATPTAVEGADARRTTDVVATDADGTAFTGSDLVRVAVLSTLLLLMGTSAVVIGRRRRTTDAR